MLAASMLNEAPRMAVPIRRRPRGARVSPRHVDIADATGRVIGRVEVTDDFGGFGRGRPTVFLVGPS